MHARGVPQRLSEEPGKAAQAPPVLQVVQSRTHWTSEAAPINWDTWTGSTSQATNREHSPIATLDCGGGDARREAFLMPAAAHQGSQRMVEGSGDQAGRFVGQATSPQGAQSSVAHASDHLDAILQLQAEMGFSKFQVEEAFKRCSTVEGAVEWILSPEREWNA
eukprot:382204-Amphidinium_carterae.2